MQRGGVGEIFGSHRPYGHRALPWRDQDEHGQKSTTICRRYDLESALSMRLMLVHAIQQTSGHDRAPGKARSVRSGHSRTREGANSLDESAASQPGLEVEERSGSDMAGDRVSGRDLLLVSSMLAEAFRFDPMYEWLFPTASLRVPRLQRVFELEIQHGLNGRALPHLAGGEGCAFWHPPGERPISRRSGLRIASAYSSVAAHHPLAALRLKRAVHKRHPKEPHWYLSHFAVARPARGRGIGRRLLEAGMRLARRDGVGAYLETTNAKNLDFYRQHGFSQIGKVQPGDAPPVWLLWWSPRS